VTGIQATGDEMWHGNGTMQPSARRSHDIRPSATSPTVPLRGSVMGAPWPAKGDSIRSIFVPAPRLQSESECR
jgi:hypothetical protein